MYDKFCVAICCSFWAIEKIREVDNIYPQRCAGKLGSPLTLRKISVGGMTTHMYAKKIRYGNSPWGGGNGPPGNPAEPRRCIRSSHPFHHAGYVPAYNQKDVARSSGFQLRARTAVWVPKFYKASYFPKPWKKGFLPHAWIRRHWVNLIVFCFSERYYHD